MTQTHEQKFNELLEKYGLQHLKDVENTTLKALRQDLELFFLQGQLYGMETIKAQLDKSPVGRFFNL